MIVSVIIQIWVFIGSQVLRREMRSFRLPTRIDGCVAMRGNITNIFNTTTTASVFQTVIKFVEIDKFYFLSFSICRKSPLAPFYGMSYFWYTMFSIFIALIVSVVVSYFTGMIERIHY